MCFFKVLTMLKVQLKAWVCSRPALGLIRGEDHLKGFQDWVMTRCVVVLGLLCVEMCLVQSWFGLFLHVGVNAVCCACLLVCWFQASFETVFIYLFICLFICIYILFCNITFLHTSPQSHLLPPRYSLTLTHTHQHTHPRPTTPPHACWIPLFAVWWLRLRSLTVVLVFLQSRKASEQAKSVDSKTDSIGSGRAIPIKQVSTLNHFYPNFLLDHTYIGFPLLKWLFWCDVWKLIGTV